MKSIKITIDGKTYNSLEEVPEEMRSRYANMMQRAQSMMDGNHGPFSGEGPLSRFSVDGPSEGGKHTVSFSTMTSTININGKTYERLEDFPEDVQRANPDLVRHLTRESYGGDMAGLSPFNPDEALPLNDFDEVGSDRRRIKASLKNHPLEKDKTPVDTKNLIASLAGIIALLLVAILVVLIMHS